MDGRNNSAHLGTQKRHQVRWMGEMIIEDARPHLGTQKRHQSIGVALQDVNVESQVSS